MTPKSLTWHGDRIYISTGTTCEVMTPVSDAARFFTTEDLSALSPDGKLAASRDRDHIVRVRPVIANSQQWGVGGVLFSCQKLSEEPVLGYTWSPDGKLLAVQQRTVTSIYQAKSGWQSRQGQQKAAYRPEHPSLEYRPIAFAPSGTRVAQAIHGGVALWDALSGRLVRTIGQGQVKSIAWDATGTYLALGKSDSTFAMHSLRGRLLVEQTGHTTEVSAMAWSPDGDFLVSGDAHGNIQVWRIGDEEWSLSFVKNLEAMPSRIEAFAWSPDERQLAVLDTLKLDIFDL